MGVRENHHIYMGRVEGESPVALKRFLPFALVQATVQQNLSSIDFQQVLRASHSAGRPVKRDLHIPPG